jgi:hypothetical protein
MDYQADITANSQELCLVFWAKLIARGRTLVKTVVQAGRLLPKKMINQEAVIF